MRVHMVYMSFLLHVHVLVAGAHLTVYHVNPLHDGVIPLNMDTADLRGDMSFSGGASFGPGRVTYTA